MLKYLGRFVSGSGALLAILFFFMPWVMVSCSGQDLGSLSGWDLAAGTNIGGSPTEGNPFVFLILILAILALLLVALPHSLAFAAAETFFGAAAIILLLVIYTGMRNDAMEQTGGMIQIKLQWGMLGTLLGYFLVIGGGLIEGGLYALQKSGKSTSPPWGSQQAIPDMEVPPAPVSSEAEAQAIIVPPPMPEPPSPEPQAPASSEAMDEAPTSLDPIPLPEDIPPVPEVAAPTAMLVVLSGPQSNTHIPLHSDNILLGRGSQCQICFPDKFVSRRHARLRYAQGQWFIQDQGSTGGTFVNGQRVNATRLNNGDVIRIGKTTLRFQIG